MKISPTLKQQVIFSAVFILISSFMFSDYFKGLETSAYDFHMRNSGHLAHSDVVVIQIDDLSIQKLGTYPTRDLLAKVLNDLGRAKPKSITFTQALSEFENDMGEQYLDALEKKFFNLKQELINSESEKERATINELLKELKFTLDLLKTDEKLARSIQTNPKTLLPLILSPHLQTSQNSGAVSPTSNSNSFSYTNLASSDLLEQSKFFTLDAPNEVLTTAGKLFGIKNHIVDADNVIRKEQLFWKYKEEIIPSLNLATYLVARSEIKTPQQNAFTLENEGAQVTFRNDDKVFNPDGKILSRFYSGTLKDNFTSYSFYDVFVEAIPTQNFSNKIVLIGDTSLIHSNKNTYSNGQSMTSLEASAHTVSSLINNDWIQRSNTQRRIEALIYLLIFFYLALLVPKLNTFLQWSVVCLGVFVLLLFEFGALEQSYWLKLIKPALFLVIGQIVHDVFKSRNTELLAQKTRKQNDINNYQSGVAHLNQGSLEQAFDSFSFCTEDKSLLSPLYKLGLEFERRRKYSSAADVYLKMKKIDSNFKDIKQRHSQVTQLSQANTQALLSGTLLEIPILEDIEKPKLGRYIIEEELGRGAMSIVYLGRDPTIDRAVAIKVQHFTGDDIDNVKKMRERFLSEAKTAGKLNHPDIVTIHDVGEEKNLAYIAMEKLEGMTLDAFINETRLTDIELIDISIRITKALDYAHRKKVIHRDIKPSNIMYDSQLDHLHITDFGIAHIQDAGLTQTGTVVGTPSYMSPEQITGQQVSPRSDLFSLGATMYQLFTSRLPFEADTLASLLYKITSEAHIPVSVLRPDISLEVERIINKLLEKDPLKRYKDAEALAKDLQHCKNTLKNSV